MYIYVLGVKGHTSCQSRHECEGDGGGTAAGRWEACQMSGESLSPGVGKGRLVPARPGGKLGVRGREPVPTWGDVWPVHRAPLP